MRSIHSARAIIALASACGLGAPVAAVAGVVSYEFTPPVVRAGSGSSALFEAATTDASLLVLRLRNPVLPLNDRIVLNDNGTGGDRVAGDGIHSALISAQQLANGMTDADVYRPFLGYLDFYDSEGDVYSLNIFAQVTTEALPVREPVGVAPDFQYTSYVANLAMEDAPSSEIARRFYEVFPDDFDFLAIVHTRHRTQNRSYLGVRNAIVGIGKPQFDNGSGYGSASRLQGIVRFPISSLFDGGSNTMVHEIGHRWIQSLSNVPQLAAGVPHWPLSDLATGVMGFSGANTQGSEFACHLVRVPGGVRLDPQTDGQVTYRSLDLYLMGLIGANAVEQHLVFANQAEAEQLVGQCDGRIYTGPMLNVSAADVIAAYGPRVPDVSSSQKEFRLATIVVSDTLLGADELSFFDFFARRAEAYSPLAAHEGFHQYTAQPFAVATQGLGLLWSELLQVPSVAMTIEPSTMRTTDAPAQMTWASSHATSCTASDAWSGPRALAGSMSLSPGAAGTYTYTLTCTGPGGVASATVPFTVTEPEGPVPAVAIVVDPSSILTTDAPATLTWSSTDATSCVADGAWSGAKDTGGSVSVQPGAAGTYSYGLSCEGPGGRAGAAAILTVTEPGAPVPTVAIAVDPPSILTTDAPATLTWSSTNATSCVAGEAWSGTKSTSGSASVQPGQAGTYAYALTCTGSGGTAAGSVRLTVTAPAAPSGDGGGGAPGAALLGGLGLLALLRARRDSRRPHRGSASAA